MSWTEEIIFELKTPVGSFSVLDGNTRIGFFAWPDDDDYELLDDQHHTRGIIHLTRYEIIVPASSLELGKSYVSFQVGWVKAEGFSAGDYWLALGDLC